jgi:hypothetical protein
MGSNFGKIGPSVEELWVSALRIGTVVGLLFGGQKEPWRWRIRRADGVVVKDRPRRWIDESRRGQAPAMGSNFGKIGPPVEELWA